MNSGLLPLPELKSEICTFLHKHVAIGRLEGSRWRRDEKRKRLQENSIKTDAELVR